MLKTYANVVSIVTKVFMLLSIATKLPDFSIFTMFSLGKLQWKSEGVNKSLSFAVQFYKF